MYTLGIETSCDDTSCAVVYSGKKVLSNITSSSLKYHKRYQGIIPEIASRAHLENIELVLSCALKKSRVDASRIDLIAFTYKPGLIGSLLVGVNFAKSLGYALKKPFIGVDHVEAHMYPVFFQGNLPKFPFIGLVISGGHTSLFLVKDFNLYKNISQTRDDAAGEAFDKVGKILNLGFPGGPIIEKLARRGDAGSIRFSCAGPRDSMDFSFSGIKTAVLYYVRRNSDKKINIKDIAASFQQAVVDELLRKIVLCCLKYKIKRVVVGGGVASNKYLRRRFKNELYTRNIDLYLSERQYCVDNAAMIAGLGYQLFNKGISSSIAIEAQP